MYQQEIVFFWPLTEQIPLELDYTNCSRPKVTFSYGQSIDITTATWNNNLTISASHLNFDVEELEFKMKEKPNLLRRVMYKIMGLKWKVK